MPIVAALLSMTLVLFFFPLLFSRFCTMGSYSFYNQKTVFPLKNPARPFPSPIPFKLQFLPISSPLGFLDLPVLWSPGSRGSVLCLSPYVLTWPFSLLPSTLAEKSTKNAVFYHCLKPPVISFCFQNKNNWASNPSAYWWGPCFLCTLTTQQHQMADGSSRVPGLCQLSVSTYIPFSWAPCSPG